MKRQNLNPGHIVLQAMVFSVFAGLLAVREVCCILAVTPSSALGPHANPSDQQVRLLDVFPAPEPDLGVLLHSTPPPPPFCPCCSHLSSQFPSSFGCSDL